MHIPVPAAAARIRNQLAEAERLQDEALVAYAELMATMVRARANPDLPVHTGQKAIIRLASAIQSQVQSGTEIFRVHDVVSTIGREIGVLDEPGLTTGSELTDQDARIAA